jgi:hypothetical protein
MANLPLSPKYPCQLDLKSNLLDVIYTRIGMLYVSHEPEVCCAACLDADYPCPEKLV